MSTKRERVVRACEFCRKRKIKCDGHRPCRSCTQNKESCVYQELPPRPAKVRKKLSHGEKLLQIDRRLARLERLLARVAGQGTPGATEGVGAQPSESEVDSAGEATALAMAGNAGLAETSEEDTGDEAPAAATPGAAGRSAHSAKSANLDQAGSASQTATDEAAPPAAPPATPSAPSAAPPAAAAAADPTHKSEEYFGPHSVISIFSDSSLSSIEASLGPEHAHLVAPIRSLPFAYQYILKPLIIKWVELPLLDAKRRRRLMQGVFPEEALVYDVLGHYDEFFPAALILSARRVRELFGIYYELRSPRAASARRLKVSELMIMSVCLSFCVAARLDCGAAPWPPLRLHDIQVRCFEQAIHYYHMVLVISDGLDTVIAVLMLIVAGECHYLQTHLNATLIAVVVRFAQEIGLHRTESYAGLSRADARTRQMTWVICRALDADICYRSGKPALTGGADSEVDAEMLRQLRAQAAAIAPAVPAPTAAQHATLQQYFLIDLTRIRLHSYHELFVDKRFTFAHLFSTLSGINTDMSRMCEALPAALRPRFFYDPAFCACADPVYWTLHLAYFSHLMLINRIPAVMHARHGDASVEVVRHHLKLTLDSARTVLFLVRAKLDAALLRAAVSWNIFFPFAAFVTLLSNCLQDYTSADSFSDVNLLIDHSMGFFARLDESPECANEIVRFQRLQRNMIDLSTRLLVRVLVTFYHTYTTTRFLETYPGLRAHLDELEQLYPDLFSGVWLQRHPKFRITDGFLQLARDPTPANSVLGSPCNNDEPPYALPSAATPELGEALLGEADGMLDAMFQEQVFGLPNFFFDST